MAAGFRSPLPILGLAAGTVAPSSAAVRSMLAPWMGGASVGMAPTSSTGPRSMLAFWMGGAGVGETVTPPDPASSTTTIGRNGWDDWDRIQRRDEAYGAIAAWKQQLRDARQLPDAGQQVPADGRPVADSPRPGGHAAIDIDARIRAQQERRALAADTDSLQPTDAMTGNGLLLAAMLALLEDDDT